MVNKYSCGLILLIALVNNGKTMETVFDKIVTTQMRKIDDILKSMSSDLASEKDFSSLDKINFYKNQTMTIAKSMDDEISAGQQQPDINNLFYYTLQFNTNVDINDTIPTNYSTILINFAKQLEKTRKNQCSRHIPSTQFMIYRIYYTSIAFSIQTFVYDLDVFFHDIITLPHITSQQLLLQKMGKQFGELSNILTKTRYEIKSYIRGLSELRIIDNCNGKKINHQETLGIEERSRPIILPDETYGDYNYGNCESLSKKRNSCTGVIDKCIAKPQISYCFQVFKNIRYYTYIDTSYIPMIPIRNNLWLKDFPIMYVKPLGDKNYCQKNTDGTIKTHSVHTSESCSACLCSCRETQIAIKDVLYFSTMMVRADIKNDKVLTGVRFVKKDRVIYTQIKEGKLMPGGWIDNKTDQWKPINYTNESLINNYSNVSNKFVVINGTLKSIKMDSLRCPLKSVVTGLQFQEKNDSEIILWITCHYISWNAGSISFDKQINNPKRFRPTFVSTITNPVEDNLRGKIAMPNFNEMSNWFDGQDVMSEISSPISGVEIYNKSVKNTGDFIAFRLYSIDYAEYGFL